MQYQQPYQPLPNTGQIDPALTRAIQKYVKAGYRVVSQTPTSAQLVRPRRFSCLAATLWTLLFGIGLIFYLFYYLGKKEDTIYLQVTGGYVSVTKGR
jgi:hypothetical protein